jgi:hypothetical protein
MQTRFAMGVQIGNITVVTAAPSLIQIVSISSGGKVTSHWQVDNSEVAGRMAVRLASQLGPKHQVRLRSIRQLLISMEIDLAVIE